MANTVDVMGGIETFRAIVNKTITEFSDDVLQTLRESAFYGCSALVSVSLPNVESVGESAFEGCSSLVEVSLPSVYNLSDGHVFEDCSSLKTLKLSGLSYGFNFNNINGCSALEAIYIATDYPTATGAIYTYNKPSSLSRWPQLRAVYVPDSAVSAYRNSSDWSTFAALIFPVSQAPDA